MKYILSKKYETPELMSKIMGPNPVKLEEELPKAAKSKKAQSYVTSAAVRD